MSVQSGLTSLVKMILTDISQEGLGVALARIKKAFLLAVEVKKSIEDHLGVEIKATNVKNIRSLGEHGDGFYYIDASIENIPYRLRYEMQGSDTPVDIITLVKGVDDVYCVDERLYKWEEIYALRLSDI